MSFSHSVFVLLFTLVSLSLLDDERDLTSPSHTNTSKDVSSSAVLRSLQVNVGPDGEETRAQNVQKPSELLSTSETSSLLQDLQPSDSTSFILLNLTRAGNCPSVCHLAGYVSAECRRYKCSSFPAAYEGERS